MKIDSEKFTQYMLAKGAYLKIRSCGMYGENKIELTEEECRAMILEGLFDIKEIQGFLT